MSRSGLFVLVCACAIFARSEPATIPDDLGYRGIWFELNQKFEYGDKYSGGLGTYTAKHRPLAIYAAEADTTFFVYGGTTSLNQKHLLCMIGAYDHATDEVLRPTVVHDKEGVDDPHDNPSLLIDESGYLWVFISGRGRGRPGFKYRSLSPYDISAFERVAEEEMTYPQPWPMESGGMFHFFTKYTGVRELYFETSAEGVNWSPDRKLAGIREAGDSKGGHYQVSAVRGDKLGTFFNRHPDGGVDQRTDLYYAQSEDGGRTWQNVGGVDLEIPLTQVDSAARVHDYASAERNVYLKDMLFDDRGHPVCLYVTSGGHEPGPMNAPRAFRVTRWDGATWQSSLVAATAHNYDMGSLYIDGEDWSVIVPSGEGPQPHGTGGEIQVFESTDGGRSWAHVRDVTAGSSRNHTYVRRPINAANPFWYIWADGNPDEFSISRLYIGDSTGHFQALPYSMQADRQKLGMK